MKHPPNLGREEAQDIVLETLRRINRALDSDENCLLPSASTANPEQAYIDLIQELLKLAPT